MDTWEFLQRSDGAWYWRHANAAGAVRHSTIGFESEADCIGNAIYHGYLPNPPRTRQTQSQLSSLHGR
jgi:hypothetical protein